MDRDLAGLAALAQVPVSLTDEQKTQIEAIEQTWRAFVQDVAVITKDIDRQIRRMLGIRYAYAAPLRRRKHGGRWQAFRDVRTNWQAVRYG